MNKKTILIVGAGGQVGVELGKAGTDFHKISLNRKQLDITDKASVFAAVANYKPDIVINAAAYTAVDKAEEDQQNAFAINRDAVEYLAVACNEHDIPLLHISTDYVFDGEKTSAYLETDPVSPKSVYGLSKAEGEDVLRRLLAQHIILRTSWVFSATGNNFVKTMLKLGQQRDQLGIVSDQQGCPTSASSIARVLIKIASLFLEGEQVSWGTYHFCNAPESNWFDFATSIFEMSHELNQTSIPTLNAITTNDYPTAAVRPMNSVMKTDKLNSTFSIESVDWRDELKKVLIQLETT